MTTEAWSPPELWTVPREWVGERCFVLCSGESIGPQAKQIAKLRGRFIAVKHGVLLRPDADVLFLSGERTVEIARPLVPVFTGRYIVVRGRSNETLERETEAHGRTCLRIGRSKAHGTLCDDPRHVTGLDSGTSAINLAYLFGATEIVLLGFDMKGGHFVADHPLPFPPLHHFNRHTSVLPSMAEDARRKGVRIVNCSPGSRVTCFEPGGLESYL